MARQIEIFPEGLVCEFEDKQPVELTKTNGRIDLLLKTLEFSLAETFTLAPPDAIPPDIPVSRAPLRQINGEGLKLLQTFEGLYLEAYKDPVGVWTIGWGCTEGICEGMKITKAQAESMLKKELVQFEAAVAKAVEVEINDNQYSALISFSYNLGVRSLFESRARYWEPDRVLRLAESGQPLVQGDDVLQVQKALIKAGFEIQADGFFGLETDQKIRQFQQQKELTIDGVVGAETLKALGL
jgi:lysozyme